MVSDTKLYPIEIILKLAVHGLLIKCTYSIPKYNAKQQIQMFFLLSDTMGNTSDNHSKIHIGTCNLYLIFLESINLLLYILK